MTSESFTGICPAVEESPSLIGQMQHQKGERSAHLIYFLPNFMDSHPGLSALLDFLSIQAGEMQATNLLAEVRDSDPILETLRKSGFSIYGWETIWRLPVNYSSRENRARNNWAVMTPADETVVRSLYQTLVPPLVQAAEPYSGSETPRLIYQLNGETNAYIESFAGPNGIYLKPVIHPAVERPADILIELMQLFKGLGKPVYLQMRSYQAWLTPALEELNASTTVHFALLVRHLAVPQYATASLRRVAIENRHAETSAPIVQKIVDAKPIVKVRNSTDN